MAVRRGRPTRRHREAAGPRLWGDASSAQGWRGFLHPSPRLGGSVGFTATFKMTVSQDSAPVCLRVHLENCLLKPWGIFQKCVP